MPSEKEIRAKLLPYNPFFNQAVVKIRRQLGLPPEGVPASVADICNEWLQRRGAHPSGGFWPLFEYEKRVKSPTEWWDEVTHLRAGGGEDYFHSWIMAAIGAYSVPKHCALAVRKYVIDNDWDSFRQSCKKEEIPTINVDWKRSTGITVTLQEVEPDISKGEWGRVYDRMIPLLAKQPVFPSDEPKQGREKANLERDFFIFLKHNYEGLTLEQAMEEWGNSQPDTTKIDLATARQAEDRMFDLLMPSKDGIAQWRDQADELLLA